MAWTIKAGKRLEKPYWSSVKVMLELKFPYIDYICIFFLTVMLPIPFFKMYGDFSPTEPLPTNFEEAVRYYKSNQIKSNT